MAEYWPKHLLSVPLAAIPHPVFPITTAKFDTPAEDIQRVQRFRRTGELGEWVSPTSPDTSIRLYGTMEVVAYTLFVALADFKGYCDGQDGNLERPIGLLQGLITRYGANGVGIQGCIRPTFVEDMLHAMRTEQSISDWFRWWYAHGDEPWLSQSSSSGRRPHQLMDQPIENSLFQEARARLSRLSEAAAKSAVVSSTPLKWLMTSMKTMTDTAALMHLHYNASLQRSSSMARIGFHLNNTLNCKKSLLAAFPEENTLTAHLTYFFKNTPPVPKWLATYAAFIEQAITVI
jgi:hypothetical protein